MTRPKWCIVQLTPVKLESFYKAHQAKRKMQDEQAYMQGIYFMHALDATVCNAMFWREKGEQMHKYLEKPLLRNVSASNGAELTEEEKQREVDLFFAQESVRRANWRRTHHKDEND